MFVTGKKAKSNLRVSVSINIDTTAARHYSILLNSRKNESDASKQTSKRTHQTRCDLANARFIGKILHHSHHNLFGFIQI